MGRLFVIGSLNVDSVIAVERHPMPGETVLGTYARKSWGGKGANQAVAAARAGDVDVTNPGDDVRADDVAGSAGSTAVVFVGRVGDDEDGRAYRERLFSLGVDVRPLLLTSGISTGSAVIAVSGAGENTIIVSSGANARLGIEDLGALDGLRPDDVVVLTLEVPLPVVVRASELAAAARARFVLNVSPFFEVPEAVIARADPIVVNEHEAEQVAERYGSLPSVLITSGAAGSTWNGLRVPSLTDIDVVDTTGAGDAYCGTFAARLAAGDGPEAAMRAATIAAAGVVGRAGAQ